MARLLFKFIYENGAQIPYSLCPRGARYYHQSRLVAIKLMVEMGDNLTHQESEQYRRVKMWYPEELNKGFEMMNEEQKLGEKLISEGIIEAKQAPLKLKVGKTYRNRDGDPIRIDRFTCDERAFPYVGNDGHYYNEQGWFYGPEQVSPQDLIKEDLPMSSERAQQIVDAVERVAKGFCPPQNQPEVFGQPTKDVEILKEGGTQFETGAVRSGDANTVMYQLISPIGLRRLAETMKEGFDKYGAYNWERGMPIGDILNHGIRHLFLYLEGDRSEDHLAHAAWNLFAAMHMEETHPELNHGLRPEKKHDTDKG